MLLLSAFLTVYVLFYFRFRVLLTLVACGHFRIDHEILC